MLGLLRVWELLTGDIIWLYREVVNVGRVVTGGRYCGGVAGQRVVGVGGFFGLITRSLRLNGILRGPIRMTNNFVRHVFGVIARGNDCVVGLLGPGVVGQPATVSGCGVTSSVRGVLRRGGVPTICTLRFGGEGVRRLGNRCCCVFR